MASRKSPAVNSSHFAESLVCASVEQATTRATSKEQIAAHFIILPPETPSILARYRIYEPPLFFLNVERDYHDDLKVKPVPGWVLFARAEIHTRRCPRTEIPSPQRTPTKRNALLARRSP